MCTSWVEYISNINIVVLVTSDARSLSGYAAITSEESLVWVDVDAGLTFGPFLFLRRKEEGGRRNCYAGG